MNVASLELCQELYELSGWVQSEHCWSRNGIVVLAQYPDITKPYPVDFICPAYEVGFLLRKLPAPLLYETRDHKWHCTVRNLDLDRETIWNLNNDVYDTPEDATAKIAIELFKQGIIKKHTES